MADKTVYPYGTGGSLPSSIGLINDLITGGANKALTAEQGKVLAETIGEGFFSEITNIDLTQFTVQNCTIGSSNKWYQSGSTGKHIAVPLTSGNTYRLTLLNNSYGGSFYAFVTSSYSPPYANNDTVPYASGQSGRNTLDRNTPILFTPSNDSAYIILTYQDGGGIVMFPYWRLEQFESGVVPGTVEERIVSLEEREPIVSLKVLAWNVGHFALGTTYDTTITQEQLETMRTKYREFLNPLGADIVLASEYNTNFVKASGSLPAVTARDAVFTDTVWKYAAIGTKPSSSSYVQQAIFTNQKIVSVSETVFPNTVQSGRYYQDALVRIGGKNVHLVCTHLDWDQGSNGAAYRALQIQKLISDFSTTEYVILGGDFNVTSSSEFDAFVNAGWVVSNHGYVGDLPTCPASNPGSCFDNIICKGFTVSQIVVSGSAELSDHLPIMAKLSMI